MKQLKYDWSFIFEDLPPEAREENERLLDEQRGKRA